MFFTAKAAVERRALQRGLRVGIRQGIEMEVERGLREERARIAKLLAKHGVVVSPEMARYLASDGCVDPCHHNHHRNRAGAG